MEQPLQILLGVLMKINKNNFDNRNQDGLTQWVNQIVTHRCEMKLNVIFLYMSNDTGSTIVYKYKMIVYDSRNNYENRHQ